MNTDLDLSQFYGQFVDFIVLFFNKLADIGANLSGTLALVFHDNLLQTVLFVVSQLL